MIATTPPTITINDLCHQTNHWGFVETPHGRMFLAKNDDGIAMRYLHGYGYEPRALALWQQHCAEAACVVDVGSHTGIYALAARQAGARQVFAVEPNPLNYARLVMNMRANEYRGDRCFLAAASDAQRLAWLSLVNQGSYLSTGGILTDKVHGIGFVVQAMPLDELIPVAQHAAIRMVKIDVEGHTEAVLTGMTAILAHRPALLVEATVNDLRAWLPAEYQIQQINEEEDGRNCYCWTLK